jgi:uncharacterized membrane protein
MHEVRLCAGAYFSRYNRNRWMMERRTSWWLAAAGFAAYTVLFSFFCAQKYRSFSYHDFDLAVHAQGMWNLLHGSLHNSILSIPYLGNHMHLIMFFALPVYALWTSPVALLFLQTLALGAAVFPLWALARRRLDAGWAAVIAVAYLLYPAVGYVNLYEFHPPAFAAFFLAVMWYYFSVRRFLPFLAAAVLSMLCQENVFLAVGMCGLLAWRQKRSARWIVAPIACALAYAAGSLALMGTLNGNTVQYQSLYGHLAANPGWVMRPQVWQYLFTLFLPLSFLPVLGAGALFPALPFFLQHALSRRPHELMISYHYTAEMLPFIFAAAIEGVAFLRRRQSSGKSQRILQGSVLLVAAGANLFLYGPGGKFLAPPRVDARSAYKEALVRLVPEHSSVVATFDFLSHLAHRRELYSFHHQVTGLHTLSDKPFELPGDLEYALIDFDDRITFLGFYTPQRHEVLAKFFLGYDWRVREYRDTVVLLSRDVNDPPLSGLVRKGQTDPAKSAVPEATVGKGAFALAFARVSRGAGGKVWDVALRWESLRPVDKDYMMYFEECDLTGQVQARTYFPVAYRIFPTHTWKPGEFVEQRVRFSVSSPAAARLRIGFYDYNDGALLPVDGVQDELGRFELKGE